MSLATLPLVVTEVCEADGEGCWGGDWGWMRHTLKYLSCDALASSRCPKPALHGVKIYYSYASSNDDSAA